MNASKQLPCSAAGPSTSAAAAPATSAPTASAPTASVPTASVPTASAPGLDARLRKSTFTTVVRVIAGILAAPFVLFFAMRILLYFMMRNIDGTDITYLFLPTELFVVAVVGFAAAWWATD